jgi:hypothetical protein
MNKKVSLLQFLVAGMLIFSLSLAFSQPAKAAHTPVTIVAIPSISNGKVYSIARVFSEPDDASRVVDVLSPGVHFNILGLNSSGSFIEISKDGQSVPSGWVSTSEVSRDLLGGISRSITQVYLEPSSDSQVVSIFTPGEDVKVLGHSQDGSFLAIMNASSVQRSIYWVASSDIKLPDVTAMTGSLTKLYIKPDTSSRITSVLPPAQQVTLLGRNSASSWFAVEDPQSNKFIGWAQSSDLAGGMDQELLPVVPMR